ncbi:MAG: molybdenum cofactor guanylyltransferase [Gemmatimonadota bacterium]
MSRSALLLAGGASSRLGRDKALVEIGGRTVLSLVASAARSALSSDAPDILLSVRDAASFAGALQVDPDDILAGVRLVFDEVPDRGPVAGFAAGLAAATGEIVAVVAADLPFVTGDLLAGLLTLLEEDPDVDAVVPTVGGRDQTLCAAFRSRVAGVAADLLDRATVGAGPSVVSLIASLDVRRVSEVAGYGAEDLAVLCRGIDTPADLEWARGRVGGPKEAAESPGGSL